MTARYCPQSSSASRFTAGAFGFLIFILVVVDLLAQSEQRSRLFHEHFIVVSMKQTVR